MILSPVLIFIAFTVFIVFIAVISTLNGFVRLQNTVRESWAGVDVALKRRHDLIPNLVDTVRAYAAHESAVYEKIAEARSRAIASVGELAQRASDELALGQCVNQFMARVENYPELKANQHFLELQRELANTEDRIAAARRFYNSNVSIYNTAIASFPGSLLAGGRRPAEFFEIDATDALRPSVQL